MATSHLPEYSWKSLQDFPPTEFELRTLKSSFKILANLFVLYTSPSCFWQVSAMRKQNVECDGRNSLYFNTRISHGGSRNATEGESWNQSMPCSNQEIEEIRRGLKSGNHEIGRDLNRKWRDYIVLTMETIVWGRERERGAGSRGAGLGGIRRVLI